MTADTKIARYDFSQGWQKIGFFQKKSKMTIFSISIGFFRYQSDFFQINNIFQISLPITKQKIS